MKPRIHLLIIGLVILASACTNTRYASNGEYDDVYFTSADKAQETASMDSEGPEVYKADEDDRSYASRTSRNSSDYRVNSYRDEVYDEDDFHYSRRLRRFSSASSSAWRYYDPFYSNDLYYVMGTNSWNRWNNYGWYSWNRPRFGSSLSWSYYNDPFYRGIYDTWGNNYGNYYNYYNPWVNTYYGFNSFYGYNPYGFGSSFNNFGFGGGYGYGFGNAYCPPYAYTTGSTGVASRGRGWDRYYVGRRASSTSSVATNTGYGRSSRTTPTKSDNRVRPQTTARPAGYSSTRINNTSNSGMYLAPKARTQTVSNRTTNVTNRTNNGNSATVNRPNARTSPRVYTRPNGNVRNNTVRQGRTTGRTNNNYSRPSNSTRTYTRPSNSTRTYSRPSNSNRTYSRPSNTYSRPSNSSRTYSRPSSTRPSSNGSSFSRPSSGSRPSSSFSRPSSSSSSSRPSSVRPSSSRSSSSSSSSRVRP